MLNGTQTQSARTHQALGDLARLRQLGVDVLRISPQSTGTMDVVGLFDTVRRGHAVNDLDERLAALAPAGVCNGYLHQQAGMDNEHPNAA